MNLFYLAFCCLLLSSHVDSYVLVAANLEDFQNIAKKLVPGHLGDKIAKLASKVVNKQQFAYKLNTSDDYYIDLYDDITKLEGKTEKADKIEKHNRANETTFDLERIIKEVKKRILKEFRINKNPKSTVTTISPSYKNEELDIDESKQQKAKPIPNEAQASHDDSKQQTDKEHTRHNKKENKNLAKELQRHEYEKYTTLIKQTKHHKQRHDITEKTTIFSNNSQKRFVVINHEKKSNKKVKKHHKKRRPRDDLTTKEDDLFKRDEDFKRPAKYRPKDHLIRTSKHETDFIRPKNNKHRTSYTKKGRYFNQKPTETYNKYSSDDIMKTEDNTREAIFTKRDKKHIPKRKRTTKMVEQEIDDQWKEKRHQYNKRQSKNKHLINNNDKGKEVLRNVKRNRYNIETKAKIKTHIDRFPQETEEYNAESHHKYKQDIIKSLGTKIPTKFRFKMSSPNYYNSVPDVAETYNYNEPLPEKDRKRENTFLIAPRPELINGRINVEK